MNDQETTLAVVPGGADDSELELADDLWDVRRAARYLCKSPSWVYREAEARRLPHRKIGRTLRFIPAELRAWVMARPGKVA